MKMYVNLLMLFIFNVIFIIVNVSLTMLYTIGWPHLDIPKIEDRSINGKVMDIKHI